MQPMVDEAVDALAARRRRLGLTQVAVAVAMGTTQPAVAKLETHRVVPYLATLARYAAAVGARLTVTLEADPEGPAPSPTVYGLAP